MRDLTTHMHDYASKVIVGDFNADQLSGSGDARVVSCFIDDNVLYSVPYGATHHTKTSDTWLDLCIVDVNETVIDYWKTGAPFIDGHDLLAVTLGVHVPRKTNPVFCFRSFKSVDSAQLTEYLRACDWSVFDEGEFSVDDAVRCLHENLGRAMDTFAPLRVFQYGKGKHPWYTPRIAKLVRERDRLYMRYRRTRLDFDLYCYRCARDIAHEAVETARLDFYFNRLEGLTDPKDIWRELRHLGVAPCSENDLGDYSVEELNRHFATVSFDRSAPSLASFLSSLEVEDNPSDDLFRFGEVSPQEVTNAIKFINSQAVGIDGIPQQFVGLASGFLSPLLSDIFNKSLTTSTFPSVWKQSIVLALSKVRPPSGVSDFRPISLLCFLSKVLERLVFNQLSAYFEAHGLLDDFQSGYRGNYSAQTTLMKLTEDVRTAMDRQQVTALLLFDFSKAFDSVCHSTLLQKLRRLGLSSTALKWVASYLTDRTQAVRGPDGSLSSFLPINRGVPQGSVLGPLLFLVYIGDVANSLDGDVRYLVYADDLQVYLQCPSTDLPGTLQRLSTNASAIADWALQNKLALNLEKTKAIVIGSYFYINSLKYGELSVSIQGRVIPLQTSVRNLGVILDAKLSWRDHVRGICRKANSVMYRLRYFRRSTNLALRKHLVQSLLFPLVDYCSLVFCDVSNELNVLLERVVNTGIRYIFGVRKSCHITPYRRDLGWLRVASRRRYFACCMLYKLLHVGRPPYLAKFFLEKTPRPSRSDRAATLVVPRWNTEYLHNSFHVSTASFWISLPLTITQSSSLASFKKRIYDYLFNSEQQ